MLYTVISTPPPPRTNHSPASVALEIALQDGSNIQYGGGYVRLAIDRIFDRLHIGAVSRVCLFVWV